MVADSRNFAKQVIEMLESSEFTDTPFVLIVEDSPTIAGILKRAFQSKGYRADIALNAYDAARYFSNTKYDVAIIDYHLPDNMGDTLLDSFHNQNKDCVYLMMTTDPKPDLALDWIKRGASAYIRKPFEPEYLIELCTKARRERSLLLVEDLLELRTQELKASEEKYRLLIDTANEGVWAMDNNHITTYANKAMADMLGYTNSEMVGKKVEEFFFPEDISFHNKRMQIRHKGKDEVYERRFRHKDGSAVWTLVSAKALKDYQGNFAGSFAMFTNITERKKAEENYQILFREMLNGFALHEIICDKNNTPIDYRFLAVNPAFERMTGLKAEDVIGRRVLEVLPLTEKYWIDTYGKVALTGEPALFDNYSAQIDKYFEVTAFRPAANQFACIFTDITERKKAEEALQASEKKYRELFDNVPVGLYQSTIDGKIIAANKTCLEIARCSNESQRKAWFNQDTRKSYVNPEDGIRLRELIKRDGYVKNFEAPLRCFDGSIAWLSNTAQLVQDETENLVLINGSFTDITERKKAEDAFKLSREQFELAVNGSNDGIWDWNLRDNTLYLSPKWKEQLGYQDHEIVNEYNTFEENLHPDDKPAVIDYVQRYLKGEFEKYSIEFRVKHKDGTYRWILARGAAIRDDSGATFRMAGSHTDITDRKEAEAEKERLQEELSQSQKLESIGRLAGGVAHDLNNMLSVILGNTDMAMDNLDPSAPIFDELKEIKDAAQRSANLTRQLLAFARKQTITPTVLDLNETVEEMLKMLRRIIGEDIDLRWQPQNGLWSTKMDPSQIDQILANLCVNARDAINGVGNLTIKTQNIVLNENGYTGNSCCRDQKESCYPICYIDNPDIFNSHYVLLSVSDDGCGMDSKTLKNIFEPFFTTKELGKGTGLGLATVYGIVKQNKGFIDVQSQLGKGATFNIYLPRYIENEKNEDKLQFSLVELETKPSNRILTVLLVEDEKAILKLTKLMIEKEGYKVLAANSPLEAINIAQKHDGTIDILITDIIMPTMNGYELAKTIISKYPDVKLLFMSGYTASVISDQGRVLSKEVMLRSNISKLKFLKLFSHV